MRKYQLIAEDLIIKIQDGVYQDKLPSEKALMALYDSSRNTIRKTTDLLEMKGIVYRVHGSGVYIRKMDNPYAINLNSLSGVGTVLVDRKLSSRLLSFEVGKADEKESQMLQVLPGSEIYRIKRVRYVDQKPYSIERSIYDKDILPYLNETIIKKSIYQYLEDDLGLQIGMSDRYLSAVPLSMKDAKILSQKVGSPAVLIREKFYLSSGLIFNYSETVYRFDQTEFFVAAQNDFKL